MKNLKVKTVVLEILIFSVLIFGAITTQAQVGIGIMTADPSAQLDVTSTTKGFLPPRMTITERNAIVNPGAGLIIYCTNCGLIGEMQYYNGTNWMSMTIGIGALPITISTLYIIGSNLLTTATCGGIISSADGNATITTRGVCWSTNSNPTIALSTKTVNGTGIGSYTSYISGLTPVTTYYVRSYATNVTGTAYGNEVVFTTAGVAQTIGNQVWLTQNLDLSTYRDGTPIPKVENAADWASLTTGAYCYYNNDSATYAAVYGKLYNWNAVAGIYDASSLSTPSLRKNLAPAGYHIPTDAEFTTLITTLGGTAVAGGKMKEAGTSHWTTPNTGADNSSGFGGLPGGIRYNIGIFDFIGKKGFWYSSTEISATEAVCFVLNYDNSYVNRYNFYKADGYSVRCIRN